MLTAALTALWCSACPTAPASRDAGTDPAPTRADAGVGDAGTSLTDAGYPQAATLTAEQLAQLLPRDASGAPVLMEVGGEALTIGEARRDAIGAAAACRDLKVACLSKTADLDLCVANVPRCQTVEPWNEAPCCAEACVAAYQEQRRLGAPPLEANAAVFSSTHECFPGLQELIRATGGRPRLLPRRSAP
jgi:hypothetical protein